MANYIKFWKVWLRLNLLTKDVDNDYTAEVSTMKNSLRNEDIAQRIVNEGSEYKYDTLLSIINQHDRIIREAVMDGYSVLTKTCQYTPRVLGPWIGSSAKFDPEKHKVTLDITLSSEMREALSHVGVEVLTVKDTITPGDDIRIEGEKIRVSGEAAGVGVFFIASDGTEHPVTRRLTTNDPKCLLARVPSDLADGQYTLRIVTQFSNTTTLLKEPRTIEYERPLTVGTGGSGGGDRPEIE